MNIKGNVPRANCVNKQTQKKLEKKHKHLINFLKTLEESGKVKMQGIK